MATLESLTDPYVSSLTPIPLPGPGVCSFCRAQPGPGFDICYSCNTTRHQVSTPLPLLLPISLYERFSQLHLMLRKYKDGEVREVREQFTLRLAGLIGRFLVTHAGCIEAAAGPWDTVTVVPSAKRGPSHPLAGAIRRLRGISVLDGFDPELLAVDQGLPAPRTASDTAFAPAADLSGRRILLIDDTYTTGASIQSASSALARSGATVVAGLVVGRFINPEFSPDVWAAARAKSFDFSVCGLPACRGR